MSDEAATNKAILRRIFEEGMNAKNLEVFDELIAPSYVNHDMPAPSPGPAGFKQVVGQFFAAFPDMHVVIEDVVAEGDKVFHRGRFTGTHRGDFMGIPATGKSIDVKYMDAWRLEEGKAVENWIQMDTTGLFQQLHATSPP